jgi:hypothetical protein
VFVHKKNFQPKFIFTCKAKSLPQNGWLEGAPLGKAPVCLFFSFFYCVPDKALNFEVYRQIDRQNHRQKDRKSDKQRDRETDGHTDRQKDKRTEGQTEKQKYKTSRKKY